MAIKFLSGVSIDNNTLFVDDANNRVGIGTGSPTYTLDVNGTFRGGGLIADLSSFTLTFDSSDVLYGNLSYGQMPAKATLGVGFSGIVSDLPAGEAMRITSAGNVGIGTTTPDSKLRIQNDNATVPSLFIRDGGTPTADHIRVSSGTYGDAFFVKATGNVGIGTSAPIGKLHIEGISSGQGLRLNHSSSYSFIYSTISNGNTIAFDNLSGNLAVYTGGSERMRVNTSGNVGIGTTAPGAKLEVFGTGNTLRLDSAANGSKEILFRNVGTGTATIKTDGDLKLYVEDAGKNILFDTTGGEKMRITAAGNVGIGTTSPSYKLQVSDTTANGRAVQGVQTGTTGTNYGAVFAAEGVGATKNVGLYANATGATTNYAAIFDNGNVGIGTTAPGSKLSVSGSNSGSVPLVDLVASGSGAFQRGVRLLNSGMSAGDSMMYAVGAADGNKNMGQFYFYYAGAGSTSNRISMGLHSVDDVFNILGTGNVGIGTTSPARALNVSNAGTDGTQVQINGTLDSAGIKFIPASGDNWEVQATTSNQWIVYNRTDNAYRLLIDGSGNVGIGTTAPSEKLTVNGGSTVAASRFTNTTTGLDFILGTNGVQSQYTNIVFYSDSGNAQIWKAGSGYSSQGGASSLNIYNSNGAIAFHPNSVNNAMFINTSGNVGIGTTSPNAKLVSSKDVSSYDFNNLGAVQLKVTGSTNYNKQLLIGFETDNNYGFIQTLEDGASWSSYNLAIQPKGGNVGIGTTAPSYKLHVNTSDSAANVIGVTNGTQILTLGVNNGAGGSFLFENSANGLRFGTSGSERMRIDASGNVGIGTTSPGARLNIAGNLGSTIGGGNSAIKMTNTDTGNFASISAGIVGVTNSGMEFSVDGNRAVAISGASDVGIGTTAPSARLHVSGGDGIINSAFIGQVPTYGASFAQFSHTSRSGANQYSFLSGNAGDTYVNSANSESIFFRNNNYTLAIITSAGNVGIGTTSPSYKLDVSGTARFSGTVVTEADLYVSDLLQISNIPPSNGNTSTSNFRMRGQGQTGGVTRNSIWELRPVIDNAFGNSSLQISKSYDGGVFNDYVNISSSGYVGIGTTSPGYKLHVSGVNAAFINPNSSANLGDTQTIVIGGINGNNAYIQAFPMDWYSQNYSLEIGTAPSSTIRKTYIKFATEGSERMRIDPAGNVGIGTTSPSNKLTVTLGAATVGNEATYGLRVVQGKPITIGGDASYAYIQSWSSGPLSINSQGNNVLFPNASTNVGIGTTSPSEKLSVVGNVSVTSGEYRLYNNSTVLSATSGSLLSINAGGFSNVSVVNGNFGIGTTGPGARLDVVSGNSSVLILQNTENDFGANQQRIDFYGKWYHGLPDSMVMHARIAGEHGDSSGYQRGNLKFYTVWDAGLVDAMTIAYYGYVGIGTASPSQKLHVVGKGLISNSGITGTPSWSNNSFEIQSSSGQTVSLEFHRAGFTSSQIWSDGNNLIFGNSSGTERMRIQDGNVGINTTSPTNPLHVDGQPRFDSVGGQPFTTVASVTQDKYIGYNSAVLTDPDTWLKISINGTDYVIPAYAV